MNALLVQESIYTVNMNSKDEARQKERLVVSESEDDNNTISSENQAFDFTVKVIQTLTHPRRSLVTETVEYMFAARVTIGCNFDFDDYPLDSQSCELFLGSYGHTIEEMVFIGKYLNDKNKKQRPLQYKIDFKDLSDDDKVYTAKTADKTQGDKFSVCGIKIVLERTFVGYILRTYFPAALIVFVIWVSYLIEQEEVVGRLALLVTLTLIEINILNGIAANKIPAKSTMAIEIYVLTCLLFVCMGLFEYAIVLYKKSPVEKKRKECMGHKSSDEESDGSSSSSSRSTSSALSGSGSSSKSSSSSSVNTSDIDALSLSSLDVGVSKSQRERTETNPNNDTKGDKKIAAKVKKVSEVTKVFDTKNIDIISGILFPCLFLLFNMVYWLYYMLK